MIELLVASRPSAIGLLAKTGAAAVRAYLRFLGVPGRRSVIAAHRLIEDPVLEAPGRIALRRRSSPCGSDSARG